MTDLRTKSDEQLIELAREGSVAAFEAIVVRHRQVLMQHCERMLGPGDAEEAVQETFVKASRAFTRGEQVRALGPWLHTIAHHVALNMLRARAARMPYTNDHREDHVRIDEAVEQRQTLRDVLAAVQSLPIRQRKALVMLVLEGRSYEEIAVRLGATPRAVSQLLNRARQSLHEDLAPLSSR
jgi:RNA polymerase sigma-70 factor, ECF subfamily